MGGGQDRHVIQMIANASLDVVEDIMRKENAMCVKVLMVEWPLPDNRIGT
jgi:hypothetical protein